MWCDLHLHSNRSDGEFPPARVVDMVADAGVGILALTDHDTTSGLDEARQQARRRGVLFVGGVEMTTYAAGRVVHVLGLGVDADDARLGRANDVAVDVWRENQLRWIAALERDGFDVSAKRDFSDAPVRLPVLIGRLCRRGVDGGDPRRCHARFREFFAAPSAAYERLPAPQGAADVIRGARGVAILAHPSRLAGDTAAPLLECVDGVEAFYAPSEAADQEAWRRRAAERGKLISCGSDFHGFFNGAYRNPMFEAPPELLARLGL